MFRCMETIVITLEQDKINIFTDYAHGGIDLGMLLFDVLSKEVYPVALKTLHLQM